MMNNRQPTVADIHLSTALASEMDNLSPHLRYAHKQWMQSLAWDQEYMDGVVAHKQWMQSLAWDQEYMDGVVAHTVIASERWPEYKDARYGVLNQKDDDGPKACYIDHKTGAKECS